MHSKLRQLNLIQHTDALSLLTLFNLLIAINQEIIMMFTSCTHFLVFIHNKHRRVMLNIGQFVTRIFKI